MSGNGEGKEVEEVLLAEEGEAEGDGSPDEGPDKVRRTRPNVTWKSSESLQLIIPWLIQQWMCWCRPVSHSICQCTCTRHTCFMYFTEVLTRLYISRQFIIMHLFMYRLNTLSFLRMVSEELVSKS